MRGAGDKKAERTVREQFYGNCAKKQSVEKIVSGRGPIRSEVEIHHTVIAMIVYDLLCACGARFEGWFHDQEGFREQQGSGLITCPTCGGAEVHKIPSPVAVHTGSTSSGGAAAAGTRGDQTALVAALHSLQEYVMKNFEDVGTRLAAEALKIHYGVQPPRNIRGITSPEEEKTLKSEGINLVRIPLPGRNDGAN